LRKNYAGVGFTYDATRDAFIAPKPYASWLLNEDTCLWSAPVAMPTDGKIYSWDEATLSWVEVIVPEVMEETVIAVEEAPTEVVVDGGVEPMVLSSAESTITLDGGNDSITLGTADTTISLDLGTGSDTVTGSATPTI
jgi:hypothetical protein